MRPPGQCADQYDDENDKKKGADGHGASLAASHYLRSSVRTAQRPMAQATCDHTLVASVKVCYSVDAHRSGRAPWNFPGANSCIWPRALPLVSRMTRAQAYPTRPCVSSLASCRRRERHPRLGELLAHHVEGENEQLGKRDPWYYLSPHHSRSYMLRSQLISSDRRLISRQELGGRASVHVWLCGNDIELSSLLDQFRDLLSIISQPGP